MRVATLSAIVLMLTLPGMVVADSDGTSEGSTRMIVGFAVFPAGLDRGDFFAGAEVVHVDTILGFAAVITEDPASFEATARKDPRTRYVEPDRALNMLFTPNDQFYYLQYNLKQIRWDIAMEQQLSIERAAHRMCFVDSGVRYYHEDVSEAPSFYAGGWDFYSNDQYPDDKNGHGTFTSSIAAAKTNNGLGIAGIAPVEFYAAKVFGYSGTTSSSLVASAIRYCADRASIISLSLGGEGSVTLESAVAYANTNDALLVAASGNDGCSGCVQYPAAYPEVIAVTGTNPSRGRWSGSSYGPEAELAAPAEDVPGAYAGSSGHYVSGSGTSMAAPHVTGVAALVWNIQPLLSRHELRTILQSTAQDVGSAGRDSEFGYGIVDAEEAILASLGFFASAGPDQDMSDADGDGFENVFLDGSRSRTTEGTIVGHDWIKDGTVIATGPTPTVPLPIGTHEITLRVTRSDSETAMDDIVITIGANVAPVAEAGPDLNAEDDDNSGDELVEVSGVASSDPDGYLVAFTWFVDGVQIGSGPALSYMFPVGSTTLTLRVTDHGGSTDTDDVIIRVAANVPPVARAGPDLSAADADGSGFEDVMLDATASDDIDGTVISYEWSVDGATLSVAATPTLTLPVGTTIVTLIVADNGGSTSSDTVAVTVNANEPPIAWGTASRPSDGDSDGYARVILNGTASSDSDGEVVGWAWYVEGVVIAEGEVVSADLPTGETRVELLVVDSGQETGQTFLDVVVEPNHPPSPEAGTDLVARDTDADGLESVSLSASGSFDDDGQIVSYKWLVDEVVVAQGAFPTAAFAVGTTSVELQLTDNGGGMASDFVDVTVLANVPPSAYAGPDRVAADSDGSGFEEVVLAGSSSDPDGTISSVRWIIGGVTIGSSSILRYDAPTGVSELQFEATDNGGAVASDLVLVEVSPNQRPAASAGPDLDGRDSDGNGVETIPLTAVASDPDGVIVSYEWLVNGALATTGESTAVNLPVGVTIVTLRVTDDGGAVSLDDVQVTVHPNRAPTAGAGEDVTIRDVDGNGVEPVMVVGSGADTDGVIAAYAWYVDDLLLGSTRTLETELAVGSTTLRLQVTDNGGATATDEVVITIEPNAPPEPRITYECVEQTCRFDGSSSRDSDGHVVSYSWALGDGKTSNKVYLEHTYQSAGDRAVTLSVTDNTGGVRAVTIVVDADKAPHAPRQPPGEPEIVDHVETLPPGYDGFLPPWTNIDAAWFHSDFRYVYVSLKLSEVIPEATFESAYYVEFTPAYAQWDPSWGGRSSLSDASVRLAVRAESPATDSDSIAPRFALIQRSESGDFATEKVIGSVTGGVDADANVIWWIVPRTMLQGPPPGARLSDPRAFVTAGTPGTTRMSWPVWDDTGTGSDYRLPATGMLDEILTFDTGDEGFSRETDRPFSDVKVENGAIQLFSAEADVGDELVSRPLGSSWTPASGSFAVSATWTVESVVGAGRATPLFLAMNDVYRGDGWGNMLNFHYIADGNGIDANMYLRFRRPTGPLVFEKAVPIPATGTVELHLAFDAPTRRVAMAVTNVEGELLGRASGTVPVGQDFRFDKIGSASMGRNIGTGATVTGTIDDIYISYPR